MRSIYLQFSESLERHAKRTAVSFKRGKRWHSKTYRELFLEIEGLASGLSKLIAEGERLAVLSENRPEWLCLDLAANKLGCLLVPIHSTANQAFIEYVINDSRPRILAVSEAQLKKHEATILTLLSQEPQLTVVLFADWSPYQNSRVLTYQSLLRPEIVTETKFAADSAIIYTSGTTGEPKGVVLSNENILSNVLASIDLFGVCETDSFLSFLPLSHVLERTLGSFVPILAGAHIAYAVGIKELKGNLLEIKPTIMIGVPRIFERMRDRIFSEIKKAGGLKEKLFYWSLKSHKENYKKTIASTLVHKKIQDIFGGRLRFAVSGGAGIHPRIIKFFDNVGVTIIEGYGLTETSPVIAANLLTAKKPGTVGLVFPEVQVKIASDKEILVKGPNVMRTYWGKESETRSAMTSEGFFMTGDLGAIDSEGYLTIIGRKKDIIVLSSGKNVYPEKLETLLVMSPYILQVAVIGHKQNFVAALIVPDLEALEKEHGAHLSIYQTLIDKEVAKVNMELMPHEQIKKIHLLNGSFSVENDELTPTLKIRRHVIESKHHLIIARLFANN